MGLAGPAGAIARPGQPFRVVSAGARGICRSWKGNDQMAARISSGIRAVLSRRVSLVAIRVYDPHVGVGCWLRAGRHFDAASSVKVTILAALLRKAGAQHRALTTRERNLAWDMITKSDNDAATALWNDVGMQSLQRFLDLAGMKQTVLGQNGYWGLTRITAHDEMILLEHLLTPNSVLTKPDRRYELRLMSRVIASERWGVTAGAPSSFTAHVKNGWLPTPPSNRWWINSLGCFTHLDLNYGIVVLTWRNPDMTYGVDTVQDVAKVINRNLNPRAASVVAPSPPFPSWGIPDERIPPGIASP